MAHHPRNLPRLAHLAVFLALSCASFSCASSSETSSSGPETAPPGAVNPCGDGFAPDDRGLCIEVAAATCDPGTMPELGKAECQPIGWTSPCPAGMAADPSGWGCVDSVPRTACDASSREDVVKGACVPVGDCNAPFPPPEATLIVNAAGPTDATHFTTISAAIAAATSKSVIAVDTGTYADIIEFSSRAPTIVGRCASKVIVTSPGGPRAGVFVKNATGGRIRGITVTGFPGGVLLEGGDLVLEDVVVDKNVTIGLFAKYDATVTIRGSKISRTIAGGGEVGGGLVAYAASVITIEDSAIVDNYFRNVSVQDRNTRLEVSRSVLARNTKLSASAPSAALSVDAGATARIAHSVITDSAGLGIHADGVGSVVEVDQSIIRRATGILKDSQGIAVLAIEGARVALTSSAITDQGVLGAYAGIGATVAMKSSVVRGPPASQKTEFGRGAQAADNGTLDLEDTAFIGLPQSGIGVQQGGHARLEHVYVRDSRPIAESIGDFGGFGLMVQDSSNATVKRSTFEHNALSGMTSASSSTIDGEAILIRATQEVETAGQGSGMQIAKEASINLTRSAIVGNTGTSIVVASTGRIQLSRSVVRGTLHGSDGGFGHAFSVFDGASADLESCTVLGSAGVGLVVAGGQAVVRGGVFAQNTVALHVQDGAEITESDSVDALTGNEVRVSTSTRFLENGSKVGTGEIPLPTVPAQ